MFDSSDNHDSGKAIVNVLRIFSVDFAVLDVAEAARLIASRAASGAFCYVATPNAVHVVGVNRGAHYFVSGIAGAWLNTCDSQIVRLLARLLFNVRLKLATGSDLTVRLFTDVIAEDDPICVIGGSPEMAERLRARFGLRRLVQHIPPYGFIDMPQAVAECVAFVRRHPSRFVFLACGAPQSEALGLHIVNAGGASGVGLCIGSALLFLTGLVRRAPPWWGRHGLEWLYRLLQEPRRMSRRLLSAQLPLLWIAVRCRLRK